MPTLTLPRVIFVLGGPGAGKGTQCKLATEKHPQCRHISVGDVLRAEMRAPDSPYGDVIRTNMQAGVVGPAHITVELLQKTMNAQSTANDSNPVFLIDGFPRKMDQARLFEEVVGEPEKVICLDCPMEELEKRLSKRGAEQGAERFDDTGAIIEKRVQTFNSTAMEVIRHYAQTGRLVQVDAAGAVDAVAMGFREAVVAPLQTGAVGPTG